MQVGPAQYDMSMKAGKQVHVHMVENLPRLSLNCASSGVSEASGPCQTPLDGAESNRRMQADSLPTNTPKLPAYNGSSLVQEFAEKFGLADDEPPDSEPAEQRSPLNWFGMMVPQALRSCQTSFDGALEVAVKLADLHAQMQTLQQDPGGNGM